MPTTTENAFLRNRVNMPTEKGSAELAQLPAQIRERSFFSARVAEAHILERFRQVSDAYSAGKIGRDEARAILRVFARENGKDDGTSSLKNLASTARLHLILDQNRAMAKAAGDYARMYKPANLKVFPYVRYVASVGSKNPRDTHQRYNGMIFDKRDPWLKTHWPPWDFGCKCQLENVTAEEAEEDEHGITPMSPPEAAETIDTDSGFSFNPEHVFEENKIPDNLHVETRREMLSSIRKYVETEKVHFVALPAETGPRPEPMVRGLPSDEDFNRFIRQNLPILKDSTITKDNAEMRTVPDSLEMGKLAQDVVDAFGLEPGEDKVFLSRGNTDFGLFHQKKKHAAEILDGRMLKAIREALGGKNVKYTLSMTPGKNNIINVEALDGTGYVTLKRKGADGHWEIVDAHCSASEQYKNKFNRV
jgi:hypothetical protein